jgi:hypothetical protein
VVRAYPGDLLHFECYRSWCRHGCSGCSAFRSSSNLGSSIEGSTCCNGQLANVPWTGGRWSCLQEPVYSGSVLKARLSWGMWGGFKQKPYQYGLPMSVTFRLVLEGCMELLRSCQ